MFMKAMKGIIKWIALIAGGTLCLAVVLTTVAYALIGTDFGARQISKVVSQMINGEANIKHVNLTLISSYPMVTVEIDGLSLTSDVLQKKEHLASADTLCATMDLGLFLDKDDIRVTEAYLVNPDFNGHVRSDGKGNFEVYESEDTTQTPMPKVWVEHLQIKDGTVRWTDEQSAMKVFSEHLNLNLKDVEYTDRIRADVVMNARKLVYEDLSSKMCAVADTTSMNVSFLMKESMIAKGSLASQGVAFRDTTMSMRPQPLHVDIDLQTDTTVTDFAINNFYARLRDAEARLTGTARTDTAYENWYTDLDWMVNIPDLNQVLGMIPSPYDKDLKEMSAGGALYAKGTAKGEMKGEQYPTVDANVSLKDAWVHFGGKEGRVDANMESQMSLNTESPNASWLKLDVLDVKAGPSYLKAKGEIKRLMGNNPYVDMDARTALNLDHLKRMIPEVPGIYYSGNLKGRASARFNMADIDRMRFEKVYAYTNMDIGRLKFRMPSEGVNLFGKNANIESGFNSVKGKRSGQTRLFQTRVDMDTMLFAYGKQIRLSTQNFYSSATADRMDRGIPFLRGSMRFRGVKAIVDDTMAVVGNQTNVSLTLRQDTTDTLIPMLRANVRMDSMMYFEPSMAALADSLRFRLTIRPRVRHFKRVNGVRVAIDPSERKTIGVDSLTALLQSVADAPDAFDEALRKFRFDGTADTKLVRYYSPYYPLSTAMRKLDLAFTDDTIKLNNVWLRTGRSAVRLKGDVQNFRRYFRRGRTLTANLDLTSRRINVNEILNAVYKGDQTRARIAQFKEAQRMGFIKPMNISGDRLIRPQVFERGYQQKVEMRRKERQRDPVRQARYDSIMSLVEAQKEQDSIAALANNDNEEATDTTALDSTAVFHLMCLPNNLNVNFNAKVDTLRFANLICTNFLGGVAMKNSTLQMKDITTNTNVGDLKLNAMYHCTGNDFADVGLDAVASNVDITNLVNTVPEVDTLVPMLRSFQGVVTLDVTAKTKLDSIYDVVMPSLSAATAIHGNDLVLMDGETFAEVAKLLMFKKKTKNLIDNMSVELILQDNQMQVLPFMLEMDKYRVAVGGENTLDMLFNYHISVLKSPLPFKLGVNVSGTMDDMKVKLGKARYKDEKTITKEGQFAYGGINLRTELQKKLKDAVNNAIDAYAVEEKQRTSLPAPAGTPTKDTDATATETKPAALRPESSTATPEK
jgi:hypothetical protein